MGHDHRRPRRQSRRDRSRPARPRRVGQAARRLLARSVREWSARHARDARRVERQRRRPLLRWWCGDAAGVPVSAPHRPSRARRVRRSRSGGVAAAADAVAAGCGVPHAARHPGLRGRPCERCRPLPRPPQHPLRATRRDVACLRVARRRREPPGVRQDDARCDRAGRPDGQTRPIGSTSRRAFR